MTRSTGKTLREIHYEKVKDYKESYKFFFHLKFQNNKKHTFLLLFLAIEVLRMEALTISLTLKYDNFRFLYGLSTQIFLFSFKPTI
jgi:hypothetical protein